MSCSVNTCRFEKGTREVGDVVVKQKHSERHGEPGVRESPSRRTRNAAEAAIAMGIMVAGIAIANEFVSESRAEKTAS